MSTQTTAPRTRVALSPELLRRIEALDGCRGRWVVDCRPLYGDRGYELHTLPDDFLINNGKGWVRVTTPQEAALWCAGTGWKARLLWHSDWLDDDARFPGGYDAPSIVRSNARVFREEFAKELERADGDADGISLDVRFVTDEMLETLLALESYPLIHEEDHSNLELELQDEEWQNWAREEWRGKVQDALREYAPDADDADGWAEEVAEKIPEDALRDCFEWCREKENEYWQEEGDQWTSHGYWIRLERVAEGLKRYGVRDWEELTGLPSGTLLSAEQQWRREPYPWPGAAPSPLVPPLPGGEA